MTLVTRGLMNKQVAGELGLSEITVKLYRARAMRKMDADTLADLGAHGRATGAARRSRPAPFRVEVEPPLLPIQMGRWRRLPPTERVEA